jgi:hypothetical protein
MNNSWYTCRIEALSSSNVQLSYWATLESLFGDPPTLPTIWNPSWGIFVRQWTAKPASAQAIRAARIRFFEQARTLGLVDEFNTLVEPAPADTTAPVESPEEDPDIWKSV